MRKMMGMVRLYNSLTRKKEAFKPLKKGKVGIYTCGPTVYDYASIGNFRTWVTADVLVRVLKFNGFKIKHVMNITDVGHLTGDNLGDADIGEDKIEESAKREGKTAWDIAKFYSEAFVSDMQKLNISSPEVMPRATQHIEDQINLIKTLEKNGFTYSISDGVYFDIRTFEQKTGKKHGQISTLDKQKAGARVEVNPEKKDPRDFALWKFSPKDVKRQMEWNSPWGIGFPGWHIECSAMSMKYLGKTFDIHSGGEDLRQIHHPNETAQSEAATGKKFVNFWLHTTFLKVNGKRMGKSLGNFYTVADVIKKGFDPLSLRYLYLTAHYRDQLNFTWEALDAASKALERLKAKSYKLKAKNNPPAMSSKAWRAGNLKLKSEDAGKFLKYFTAAIEDDLNTPQALAVMWDLLKSKLPEGAKRKLLLKFDNVLGLGLGLERVTSHESRVTKVPQEVMKIVEEREEMRKAGEFKQADELRVTIKKMGYILEDKKDGTIIKKK